MDKRFETPFFIGLILFSAGLLAFIFLPYLGAIVLAVALAIIFNPVYLKLCSRMPGWERAAAFLTVVIAIIIILVPLSFFGFKIFQESQELYQNIEAGKVGVFIDFLNDQATNFFPWFEVDLNQYLERLINALTGSLGAVFSKVANTSISVFVAVFSFYYFLKDRKNLKKAILKYSPLSPDKTQKIIYQLINMANAVIKGSLVIAVVQGVLMGVGLFIFGLPSPVLWGAVAVVSSLIPVLGVGVIAIPGIVSLVLTGHIAGAIGLTIWSVLVVGLADNFLRPFLIERDLKVHPLLIFFSVLGGLAVFGAIGLILGPLVLSLFLAMLEIYPVILKEKTAKSG